MSTATRPEPLVDPTELASFEEAEEKIRRAREVGDRVPAELDDASASQAADALKEIRIAREDVETLRKAEKAPYTVTGQKIDIDFKEVQSPLLALEESLKERIIKHTRAKQEAAGAERKRQEENARRRQAREDAKAKEESRASHDKRGAPPPPPPPPRSRGAFATTTVKNVKKHAIEDESMLPDEYLIKRPDARKIASAVAAGLAVPGVRVWEEPEVATR